MPLVDRAARYKQRKLPTNNIVDFMRQSQSISARCARQRTLLLGQLRPGSELGRRVRGELTGTLTPGRGRRAKGIDGLDLSSLVRGAPSPRPSPRGSDFLGPVCLTLTEAKIQFKPVQPRNPRVDLF